MSKKYSSEEQAAYWKAKALAKQTNKGYNSGYKPRPYKKKSKAAYAYKTQRMTAKSDFGSKVMAPAMGAGGGIIGGLVGSAFPGVGTAMGTTIGGALGSMAGNAINYFTGYGDYKIRKNALMPNTNGNMPIRNAGNSKLGGTVFQKSEYLGEVVSGAAGTFNIKSYDFNPGNQNMFPWLSEIASNYQQYIVEGCYIEFKSMSGNALNSVNTALGQVIMSAQYNSNDVPFQSKQEMENYEYGTSFVPSTSCRYFFECARGQNVLDNLYIASRKNIVPNTSNPVDDVRFENLCTFSIATNGLQGANVNLGELWITYQVRLLKTKLFDSLGLANANFRCLNLNYSTVNPPFGTYTPVYDNIGMSLFQTGTINGVQFPYNTIPSSYLVIAQWSASTAAIVSIVPGLHATPSAINSLTPVGYISSPTNGTTSTKITVAYFLRTAGNGQTLNLYTDSSETYVLPSGTNQTCSLQIIQMPNDYI